MNALLTQRTPSDATRVAAKHLGRIADAYAHELHWIGEGCPGKPDVGAELLPAKAAFDRALENDVLALAALNRARDLLLEIRGSETRGCFRVRTHEMFADAIVRIDCARELFTASVENASPAAVYLMRGLEHHPSSARLHLVRSARRHTLAAIRRAASDVVCG